MEKTLKELTIKDNFMFGAVMTIPENCKGLLEMIIGKPIARVIVSKEKSMIYHPEYKGVRLDIYAKDEENTHYNIEMQMVRKSSLGKRTRYYQSQLDMELLFSGREYAELPNTFVIFICDFDPFGEKLYQYSFKNQCKETETAQLKDGREIIFLSTRGKNEHEVPKELVTFLNFVRADLKKSQEDFQDGYVKRLQDSICHIKESREMEEKFMTLKELLKDEYNAGLEEGLKEGRTESLKSVLFVLLERFGGLPKGLEEMIKTEKDVKTLTEWVQRAADVKSIPEFMEGIQ